MSLTFPHSRACLPTSLAHVFLPPSLFAPLSCSPVFPALLAHGPLGPMCIRAAFLPCQSRSFWSREGFPGQPTHRLSHPTDFRSFVSSLLHFLTAPMLCPTQNSSSSCWVSLNEFSISSLSSPPLGMKQSCPSLLPPSPLPVADLLLLGFLAAAAAAALSRDPASSCPILTVLHSQRDQK